MSEQNTVNNNIYLVQQLAALNQENTTLKQENATLNQENSALNQENIALKKEISSLKEQFAAVQEQYEWLKKQVFGRKTEQTSVVINDQQLSLSSDEVQAVSADTEEIKVSGYKRKKKRTHDDWMKSLEIEEKHHEIENPVCEYCGSEMEEIGEEKAYDELIYTPAKYHIRRHFVKKYKCPNCGENPEASTESCNIVRAKAPVPMIPRSFSSPEIVAHIIYEKFCKAVPLHRQEKDFKAKGIPLLKATMSNWVCYAAENWCYPVIQKLAKSMLSENVIHADETVLQVLHEKGRKPTTNSCMWVYCNGRTGDKSAVIFEYQPTRSGEHPARFLKGYCQYIVCDGCDSYNAVTTAIRCGCWAHARRKFVEAMPSDKKLHKSSVAAKAVEYCDRIYHEENLLKDLSAEERYNQRLVKVKPILEAFFEYIKNLKVDGKGKLSRAIGYALNEKKYLCRFLENGDVPIDNNRAENAIRPFAVGRKNWLFNNTANGAKCSATLYSIVSTALDNGLDVEKYLTELFSNPAGTILMPWRD